VTALAVALPPVSALVVARRAIQDAYLYSPLLRRYYDNAERSADVWAVLAAFDSGMDVEAYEHAVAVAYDVPHVYAYTGGLHFAAQVAQRACDDTYGTEAAA
jgi:hypothetical protein